MSNTQNSPEDESSTDQSVFDGEYNPEAVESEWQRRWVEKKT
jgi:hypothetical protein